MSRATWSVVPIFALVCVFALALPARGQEKPQPQAAATPAPQAAEPPAAKPADVASPDAILAACYDVISGPAGPRKDKPGIGIFVMTPKDYSDRAGSYFDKNGFVEREASRKTERYGNIMQVFSTYESRHDAKDEKPFARGINSFQLYNDGTRWWIVTIMWQEETPDNPLPKEFLTPVAK